MKKLIVLSIVIAMFLVACQTNGNNGDAIKYEDIVVSVEEAFDIFMDKYPNTKINEIQLEFEDTTYEYDIKGYEGDTEYELKIDAFTKNILKDEKSVESGEVGEIRREDLGKIDQYVKSTLDDAGSEYWLNQWELKAKIDYVEFHIEVKNKSGNKLEYEYNYETGELIEKD